ncbi:alpha/beta-hydrolase [Bimuria novae-zelandiae CBS 107.79]|uniref:Alpha/beta-hydrolase n=1 Tax=Bimuria novae-zelandiae CBS 107.79 TaxID=1447943 RepID=A0A6A5W285_9PLEO|nr:alpha/beta-hydrolase [Bimuria novae-zelandiae CBS 107.79]
MSEIKPFDPSVPQDEVDRLFRKLKDTRLPQIPVVPDADDDYGQFLNDFSWPDAQKQISKWYHYTTEIENLKVYFIHEKARPSGSDQPSFDLVVPSLPGSCWSQGAPRGWTLQDTARIYDVLMKRLGYKTYVAQAGDWGHWVVRELGSGRYDACKAVHTNRSTTILLAFMMFIGEEYQELADPNLKTATLENKQFNHDVCTMLPLYFFTPPPIITSMLCYYNNARHEVYTKFNAKEKNLIRVPLGVSTFPYDAFPVPEKGAETTTTNLQFFKEQDHGGHFACMECPKEMVNDIREFFPRFYKP